MEGITVRIFKNHPIGNPHRIGFGRRVLPGRGRTVRLYFVGPVILMTVRGQ